MVLAVNTTRLKNGRSVTGAFTARVIVDQKSLDNRQLKLKYVEVFTVRNLKRLQPVS